MNHRWRLGRSVTGNLALCWSASGAAIAKSASERPVSQIHSRLLRCASRTFAASVTSRSPRATSMGSGEPIPAKDLIEFSQWSERADLQLSSAAKGALSKIASVLPQDLRTALDTNSLVVGKGDQTELEAIDLSQIRRAIRVEHKVLIKYLDLKGASSERTIWPVALGYFDHARMLAGWCELRQEFRHFRTDRISALRVKPERYPRRRQVLLKEWREVDILQRHQRPPQHLSQRALFCVF